jgi:lysophospholipid acyltransferase (LPLAT)-like uncharacterized protein
VSEPVPNTKLLSLKNKRTMPEWMAAPAAGLLNTWAATCRLSVVDPAGCYDAERFPMLVGIWHNRIPLFGSLIRRDLRRRVSVLISASRDGNYGTAVIRHLGLTPVRGSSSKGGMKALRELLRELEEKRAIVIPLDGPRGPRYEVQPGIFFLARKSGVPIVPACLNAPDRWQLRSWDMTQIPKPFSRVELRLGEPLFFPDGEERNPAEDARRLRRAMLEITRDRRG